MQKAQERLLKTRLRVAIEQQPQIQQLRKVLLGLGGIQLVAPPQADPALSLLIEAGFGMVGIGTGYALSGDGLWRQHSWGLRREGILETTVERAKYFGVLPQRDDAESFAQANRVI